MIAPEEMSPAELAATIDELWALHSYKRGDYGTLYWRGRRMLKNPLDVWIFVEVIHAVRPDLIIETGTFEGASAVFFAEQATLVEPRVQVVSIDINRRGDLPTHRGVDFWQGRPSTDPGILSRLRRMASHHDRVMVILDSNHSARNVTREMNLYGPLVTSGSYMIVEDSNINGHPVEGSPPEADGGPWAALEFWLPQHPEFVPDRHCERFGVTFNPNGWLRRI